jgi:hypothetical protein
MPPDPPDNTICCASHPDWATLAQHMQKAFKALPPDVVARQVLLARDAVMLFGLSPAAELDAAERIVRHELLLMTGEIPDTARLKPEARKRRASSG